MGEIATATRAYPAAYTYIEGRTYPDSLEGVDWLFYTKPYSILHANAFLPQASFQGLGGILGLLDVYVIRDLAALLGLVTDPIPALEPVIGSLGTRYTTGPRDVLIALAAPVIEHFWFTGRALDLVSLVAALNEIDPAGYIPLFMGASATLRTDTPGGVLKTLEGPAGYGIITYALRGHAPDDGGILDPLLDLGLRLIRTLEDAPAPEGHPGTLLEALCDAVHLDLAGEYPDLDALLFGDGQDRGLLDRLYAFLADGDNLQSLSDLGAALGRLTLAVREAGLFDQGLDVLVADDPWAALTAPGAPLLEGLRGFLGEEGPRDDLRRLVQAGLRLLPADGGAPGEAALGVVEALLACSETLLGDLERLLPPLGSLANMLTLEGDAGKRFGALLAYLLRDQDGRPTPCGERLFALVKTALDLRHPDVNPQGLGDATPLNVFLAHLLGSPGEPGLYDLRPALDFPGALCAPGQAREALWCLVAPAPGEGLLAKILRDQHLTLDFVRALCTPVAGDAVVLRVLRAVHLQGVDMNGVLEDLARLLAGTDLRPGGATFELLLELMTLISREGYVRP